MRPSLTGLPSLRLRSAMGFCVVALLALLAPHVVRSQPSQPPDKRTIRVVIVDLNYRPAYEAVAREYMKLHPNVDVQVQIVSTGGYATWIRTALAGGEETAPDIYSFNFGSGFYESGKAINLLPYLESVSPYTGQRWRDSFILQYIEMLSSGNDVPQVPLNYVEVGIFYNRDIFDRVGVQVPQTWEELIEICRRLKEAGYIPLAMPAEKEGYWGGVVGWVVRLFTDAWYYDLVPHIAAQPGDYLYDPLTDADFEVRHDDPFNDLLVSDNIERRIQSMLDGRIDFDGPRMRDLYTRLKEFSQYWQRGFHGADPFSVYNLFITQRAAMMFNASPAVLVLERDIARLAPEEQFEWGAFHPPAVTTSPFVHTPFRGVGAPLPVYGIIRKSREQNNAAADFLMFLTSPQMCRLILEETIKAEEAVVGPFAILDVPLDEEMDAKFRPFLGHGREKLEIRGLADDQESVWRWSTIVQDYMAGRIDLDSYLERYQRLMIQSIPTVIRRYELDMDPTTRDNNGPLIREVTSLLEEIAASEQRIDTVEALIDRIEANAREYARHTDRDPDSAFDLLIERTIPILVTDDPQQFQHWSDTARQLAEAESRQYLILVQLGGDTPLRHQVFDFRPTYDEIIAGLSGERYSREQLQRLLR